MKSSIRSQSAVEFVVLSSFMLLVIVGFFAVTSSRVLEAKDEENLQIAQDIAEFAYRELEIATTVNDGYVRTFSLPREINGVPYNITIIDNRELLINYTGNEYIKFLQANITGNLSPGLNQLRKISGIIYVNPVKGQCENTIDDDSDTLFNEADPGCYIGCNYLNQNNYVPENSETDSCTCGSVASCCEGTGLGSHYAVFDSGCIAQECWSGCIKLPPFLMRNALFSILSFRDDGNAILKGTLQQGVAPQPTDDDEFIFKDRNGNNVAIVSLVTGNMVINGNLIENQEILAPEDSSNDLVIKNSTGKVISYFDESGNLLLKGTLTQNGNP